MKVAVSVAATAFVCFFNLLPASFVHGFQNVSSVACGTSSLLMNSSSSRIVGGVVADWGQLPFIVQLESPRGQQLCGASILSDRWLVTAAHCVASHNANEIVAIAGSLDPSDQSEEEESEETTTPTLPPTPPPSGRRHRLRYRQESLGDRVYIAPGYQGGTQLDLALIRLKRPFKWNDRTVRPVCLPDSLPQSKDKDDGGDQLTQQRRFATVAGWGWNDENGESMNNRLHLVQLPLVSRKECEKRFRTAGYQVEIDKTKICAGWLEGGKDACQGDSGGPMVVSDHTGVFLLTGVVSGGIGCARPGLPGLYTNVAHFVPWILQTLKKRI